MRLAVTGASGFVGRFIVKAAHAAGHEVTALGRRPNADQQTRHAFFDLDGPPPDLRGIDALIHAAFSHAPGRYRGGEGDDPASFVERNVEGTLRLLDAAEADGVARFLFLSSRAVYGAQPPGLVLREDTQPHPDTLYGETKLAVERALAARSIASVSLRTTGVYGPAGPGRRHKWADLFDDFARGVRITPRLGTEVHGADLAAAALLALEADAESLNVSDILLDRRELLRVWSQTNGIAGRLPEATEVHRFNEMATDRLRALGWRPRGLTGLVAALRDMGASHA